MNSRRAGVLVSGVVAAGALAAAGWFALAPSSQTQAEASARDEAPPGAATQAPALPSSAATLGNNAGDAAGSNGGSPGDAAAPTADEAAVLAMYENMADAVDAYGPNACAALGQAFGVFVSDGSPATARLVRATKEKGQDFTAWFEAAHGPQLERVKEKLKEALTRCGGDPGLQKALTDLAKLSA